MLRIMNSILYNLFKKNIIFTIKLFLYINFFNLSHYHIFEKFLKQQSKFLSFMTVDNNFKSKKTHL